MCQISIIIPLHNKGEYVEAALRSLQVQTCEDWEAWVVENNSLDDGPERVASVAAEDSRIHLLRAPITVRGPGAARNLGLDNAKGQWVMFFDADDLLVEEHLESVLDASWATAADVIATDWFEFVEGALGDLESVTKHEVARSLSVRHHAAGSHEPHSRNSVQDVAIAYAPWAVHCGLIRRALLTEHRRWVEVLDHHPSEDTAFWFRVLWGRQVAYTRRATAIYRTETPNFRNAHRDLRRWARAMEAIHEENVSFLKSEGLALNAKQAECLMRVWSKLGWDANVEGDRELAASAYRRAAEWQREAGWCSSELMVRKIFGCRLVDRIRFSSRAKWKSF